MNSVRIITHCYAADLPQYATFLRAQLSSLVIHETQHAANITVCCAFRGCDDNTHQVLDEFKDGLLKDRLLVLPFQNWRLFRRAIGRNIAGMAAQEDLVWFTDVDYVFGEGCFDSLIDSCRDLVDPKPVLVWPKKIFKHLSQEVGDAWVEEHKNQRGLISIDQSDFCGSIRKKPIGGIQISTGDFIRKHGYLHHAHEWQQPESVPFRCFRDDRKFRLYCESVGIARRIPIQNVYRLRHTKTTYK